MATVATPEAPTKGWWARNYGDKAWVKAIKRPASKVGGAAMATVKAPRKVVKGYAAAAEYADPVKAIIRKGLWAITPNDWQKSSKVANFLLHDPERVGSLMKKAAKGKGVFKGLAASTKVAAKAPLAAVASAAGPASLALQGAWDGIHAVSDFASTEGTDDYSQQFFSHGRMWGDIGKRTLQGLVRGLDYLTFNTASSIGEGLGLEGAVATVRGEAGWNGWTTSEADDHGYGQAIENASTPAEAAKVAKKFEEAELTALSMGKTIYGDDLYDVDAKTGKLYKVTKEEGARRAKVILSASEAGKRARALSAYDEVGKKLTSGKGDIASMRKKLGDIWANYEQKLNRLDAELEGWDEDALRREASSGENGNLRRIAQTKLRLGKEGYEDLVVNNLNNEVARYRAPLVESDLYKRYMDNQYQEYAKAQRMLVERYAPQMLNDPDLEQKIKGVWDANFSDAENEDYSRAREVLGNAESIFQEEESQILARARAARDAQEATRE